MGQLWQIIQAHIDVQRYPVSERQIAKALHVSPTTIRNWKNPRELPSRDNLRAIARLTGDSYSDVLAAALADTGYTEGIGEHGGDTAARTSAGSAPAWDERAAALQAGGPGRGLSMDEVVRTIGPRPPGEVSSPGSGGVTGHASSDQRRA